MKIGKLSVFQVIEYVLGFGLLAFLLFWHLKAGMTRFFDVDEFTHLHWAANMASGQKPYIDFFTFFTPGFYWFLLPLFWIFGKSIAIFTTARFEMFLVFAVIVGCTGAIFALLRKPRYAYIPMILLAFLPMPYDKFLEVRPDNLSTMLGLVAVVLQIWAIVRPPKKNAALLWFFSGLCYSLAFLVLVKILPFIAMGGFVALLDAGVWEWLRESLRKKRVIKWTIHGTHWMFLAGLAIPVVIFLAWFVSLGNISTAWYSLTKLPFEANTIGLIYIMEPHLFFFPNASFYGGWGVTPSLLMNHTIWFFGIMVGSIRFLAPFLSGEGDRKRVYSEILLSGIFMLSVFGYVLFFPLKHSQYLIPIAIFIALYAADCVVWIFEWVRVRWGRIAVIVALAGLGYILITNTLSINYVKIATSNTVQLSQTQTLLSTIPQNDRVLDLDGRMLFWPDAYHICCLPFGSFVRFLSRPPVPLARALESQKIPYIFQGDSGRLWDLADLSYIQSHYTRVAGWGDALWKRNDR